MKNREPSKQFPKPSDCLKIFGQEYLPRRQTLIPERINRAVLQSIERGKKPHSEKSENEKRHSARQKRHLKKSRKNGEIDQCFCRLPVVSRAESGTNQR